MSHRMPATRADKHFNAIDANLSTAGLEDKPYSMGEKDTFSFAKGAPSGASMEDVMLHGLALRRVAGTQEGHDVALWSRWRYCRHVYRFDRALSRELCETPLPDTMPLESLNMLPYPIVYVDAPIRAIGYDAEGFFAWVDGPVLCIVLMLPDGYHQDNVLNLDASDLGHAVTQCVDYDVNFAKEKIFGLNVDLLVGEDFTKSSRQMYTAALNHLLYIVSDAEDQRISYRPSQVANSRKKRRSSRSTIHVVGEVAGRALGAARVRYVGRSHGGDGGTKRPHVRAAHYHHYWTGPKSEPEYRKLVLHWIPPVFVGGMGGETLTTVHKSQ